MKDYYLEEFLKDPERMTKIYLAINIGIVLSNLAIVIGAIIFVLMILGIV